MYQPWASLVRDLLKPIETRSWHTKYRGPLAIHAGLHVDEEACLKFGYDPSKIETGVILCTCMLVNCVRFPSPLAKPDPYGDYTPGRYGFVLASVVPLEKPIPAKGNRMLWNCDLFDTKKQTRLV